MIIKGNINAFIEPWLIVTTFENPLDLVHEIAHALLYYKGFSKSWAIAHKLTEREYEALVWAVAEKFAKDSLWNFDYIQEKINSH